MGKLTDEQAKLLEELTELANSPDDDFELEIGSGDKWARIPASQGKTWLAEHFGIGAEPPAPAGKGDDGQDDGQGDTPRPRAKPRAKPAAPAAGEPIRKYFGVRK